MAGMCYLKVKNAILSVLEEVEGSIKKEDLLVAFMKRNPLEPISFDHFRVCMRQMEEARQIEYASEIGMVRLALKPE